MESTQGILLAFQMPNSVDSVLLLVGHAIWACMYVEGHRETQQPQPPWRQELRVWGQRQTSCLVVID